MTNSQNPSNSPGKQPSGWHVYSGATGKEIPSSVSSGMTNPKSETRNPKQAPNSNDKFSKPDLGRLGFGWRAEVVGVDAVLAHQFPEGAPRLAGLPCGLADVAIGGGQTGDNPRPLESRDSGILVFLPGSALFEPRRGRRDVCPTCSTREWRKSYFGSLDDGG